MNSSLVPIGQLGKTHGLFGELRFYLYKPYFEALLKQNEKLRIGAKSFVLSQVKTTASHLLVMFTGVNTPEHAQQFVNQEIFFPIEQIQTITPSPLQLPEQWIGWEVHANTEHLGLVVDILHTPANDVLTIKNDKEEWLVPVIPEYILSSNPENKTLHVKKPIFM